MTIFYDFWTTVQKYIYAFKLRTQNVENKIYKHFMKRNLFTYIALYTQLDADPN